MAEALAYAHGFGIVHRDIKPANVRLDAQGVAYLMDFGIAYRPDSGEPPAPPGTILGTPAYIAPEQAQGASGAVLPASDQYSLGAVLYELLCGRPPFCGPPSYVLFHAIHHDPPDPRAVDPTVPRPLAEICRKAMAKRPERRYPSCQAFAADLRRWLQAAAPPVRRRRWFGQGLRSNPSPPRPISASELLSLRRSLHSYGGRMNESEDSSEGGQMPAGCLENVGTLASSRSSEPLTKLLVVDDSEFEHQVIAGLLRGMEGLHVLHASGGIAALEAIECETPDIVLTDLFMPDMDGLELVQKVHERRPGVPLILMTAFGSEEAAIQALRAGAANYLPKQDLARDLVATVRQVLDVFTVERRRRRLLQCVERRESVFEIGNEPELVGSLVQLLQEEIDGLGVLDRPARIRIRVALQEALTNALYHGNLEVGSDLRQEDERIFFELAEGRRLREPYRSRRIRIATHLDRHAATFVIRDEGPGFDTSRIDRPIDPEDLLRIGGRGLLLIRTFMDRGDVQ